MEELPAAPFPQTWNETCDGGQGEQQRRLRKFLLVPSPGSGTPLSFRCLPVLFGAPVSHACCDPPREINPTKGTTTVTASLLSSAAATATRGSTWSSCGCSARRAGRVRSMESRNPLQWERPLGSLSPTVELWLRVPASHGCAAGACWSWYHPPLAVITLSLFLSLWAPRLPVVRAGLGAASCRDCKQTGRGTRSPRPGTSLSVGFLFLNEEPPSRLRGELAPKMLLDNTGRGFKSSWVDF